MTKLVRLWKRPCKNGLEFKYVLIWYDESGKERWSALGHADKKKAEKAKAQKEREVRMGFIEPGSMKLSVFLEDCIERSRGQVRESTIVEYRSTMTGFIQKFGDVDICKIRHEHGERYIQHWLDKGNRPATVSKKIGTMKRLFQLAVQRGQLDENPFRFVRKLKYSEREIHTFSNDDCIGMIGAARNSNIGAPFRWDILILTALCTGMRRGELLNLTWRDVDFEKKLICIRPKENTKHTWEWHIKDTDRRKVPLTDEVIQLLVEHQSVQPSGYPYVFVTPSRYDFIQEARETDKWNMRQGRCPIANFRRQFNLTLEKAGIDQGEFHDLRRTCLTNWFANGLSEYDVMSMAGHASFETTRRFYLAISHDVIDWA